MGIKHTYYRLKHFYNGLSNRILGVILLIVIILTFYFLYWYIFIYSLFNVELKANVDDYKVKFYSNRIVKTFDYSCKDKNCNLEKISALDYDVTISKEGYEDFKFKFNPKIENQLSFKMIKKVLLKPIIEEEKIKKELSREQKIDFITKKHNNFLLIEKDSDEFIIKENKNKLDLYLNSSFILSFGKTKKEDIYIENILGTNNKYLLLLGENKFLLNKDFFKTTRLKLKLDIIYAKQINAGNLLFVTPKGSFIYDLKQNNFNYFNKFFDFIVLDTGNFIGILKDDISIQKNNFGLVKEKGDLLIHYNSKTKKVRLLKNLGFDVSKIYKDDISIFVMDDKKNKFEILNY